MSSIKDLFRRGLNFCINFRFGDNAMIAQYEKNILQFLVKKNVLTTSQAMHIAQNMSQVRQSQPTITIVVFLQRHNYITAAMAQKLQQMIAENQRHTGQISQVNTNQTAISPSTVQMQQVSAQQNNFEHTAVDVNIPKPHMSQDTTNSTTKHPHMKSNEQTSSTTGQISAMSSPHVQQSVNQGVYLDKNATNYVEETAYPVYVDEKIGNSQLGNPHSQLSKDNPTQQFRVSQFDENDNGKKMFRHYHIERELGRGGMGLVLLAYDTNLDRRVALKVIINEENISEQQIRRFAIEARATAKLKHPNIVEVYEAGNSPKNYFTMEYIKGKPFSALIQKGGLQAKDIAAIMKKCCDAIYYAHKEHKIIHRDIKPSNIMMADKEPKIMDFGLAKEMDRDEQLSHGGGMMGTLGYMPPEQVDNVEVGHHSDVYALGATLYNALTGRPPFQGSSYYMVLNQIHNDDPIPPSQLAPGTSKELEAICLKCLQKKPQNRYRNAKELADDLANFLYNRPVNAKPPSLPVKAYKWYKRNKVKTLVSAAFIMSLVAITLMVVWNNASLQKANEQIEREKNNALQAHQEAESKREDAMQQLVGAMESKRDSVIKQYQLTIMAGQNAADKNRREITQKHLGNFDKQEKNYIDLLNTARSKDYYTELLEIIPNNSPVYQDLIKNKKKVYERGWEWQWLKTIASPEFNTEFSHPYQIISCVYHPQHEQVICGDKQGNIFGVDLPLSKQNPTYIWQSKFYNSKDKISGYRPGTSIEKLSISPDGKYLVSHGSDFRLLLWDLQSHKLVRQYINYVKDHPKPGNNPVEPSDFIFTKDSKNIIAGYKEANVDTAFQVFNNRQKFVPRFANAVVWSVENDRKPRHQFFLYLNNKKGDGLDHSVVGLDLSSDGNMLAVGRENPMMPVVLINLKSKKERILKGPISRVMDVCFSEDNRYVIAGDESQTIFIWNTQTGKLLRKFIAHDGKITRCVIRGNILMTAATDNTIHLWDLEKIRLNSMLVGSFSENNTTDIFIDRSQQKIVLAQAANHLKSISLDFVMNPTRLPGNHDDYRLVQFHPQDSSSVLAATKYKFFSWQINSSPIRLSLIRVQDAKFNNKNDTLGISLEGQKSTLFVKFGAQNFVKKLQSLGMADPDISMIICSPKKPSSVAFHPKENKALVGLNYNRDTVQRVFLPNGEYVGRELLYFYQLESKTPQLLWSSYFRREIDIVEVASDGQQMLVVSGNYLFVKDFATLEDDIKNNRRLYGNLHKDFRHRENNMTKYKNFLLQRNFRESTDLKNLNRKLLYACFSPNGKYIAVAASGTNNNLLILDAQSLKIVATLKDHLDYVSCCSFSPDGKRLVSCGGDKTVRVWDLENLEQYEGELNSVLTLRKHTGSVAYCAFSGDGKNIASCGKEELLIWKTK